MMEEQEYTYEDDWQSCSFLEAANIVIKLTTPEKVNCVKCNKQQEGYQRVYCLMRKCIGCSRWFCDNCYTKDSAFCDDCVDNPLKFNKFYQLGYKMAMKREEAIMKAILG